MVPSDTNNEGNAVALLLNMQARPCIYDYSFNFWFCTSPKV